jgi:hypothetical protein
MKKILLSAITVIAFGTVAQAQEISLGAKAGVNFSNYGGDEVGDSSARTGFHIGLVSEFKLTETFAIAPELLFSQQGSQTETKFDVGGSEFVREDKQTLNYINIPIAAKYYITEGLSIHAGPQIGFLVSANSKYDEKTTIGGVTTEESAEVDNKDGFESVDFGVFGGLGYELPMGVFFQARYTAGLSSVFKNSEELDSADIQTTNNVFSLSVGYKFM